MPAKLKLTLVKSTVSHTARTRATVRALGLHRIGDSVEISDTPEMRGMVRAVRFLLRTDEADAPAEQTEAPTAAPKARKTKEEAAE